MEGVDWGVTRPQAPIMIYIDGVCSASVESTCGERTWLTLKNALSSPTGPPSVPQIDRDSIHVPVAALRSSG